jgi:hypothetical protein
MVMNRALHRRVCVKISWHSYGSLHRSLGMAGASAPREPAYPGAIPKAFGLEAATQSSTRLTDCCPKTCTDTSAVSFMIFVDKDVAICSARRMVLVE